MSSTLQTTDSQPPEGSVHFDFPAIEAMQEASEAAGWEVEYRQIGAGPFRARTYLRDQGDVSFMREGANRQLQVIAKSPADAWTLIVSTVIGGVRVNAFDIGPTDAVVLPPESDVIAMSQAGAEGLSVHIARSTFRRLLGVQESDSDPSWMRSAQRLRLPAAAARQIQWTIATAISVASSPGGRLAGEWRTALAIDAISAAAHQSPARSSRGSRDEQHRALRMLLDYIDENLGSELRIVDLCALSGRSVSTLERLFRRDVGMTPVAYIRSRRLDAVRRVLAQTRPDRPIARIAFDHGFTHMGRFAGEYRRQFGILPSADRRITSV